MTVCTGEVVEQGEHSFTVGRSAEFYSHYGNLHDKMVVSQMIETDQPQDTLWHISTGCSILSQGYY